MGEYYILITDAGAALEAAAHAAGEKVELAEFGVCDGGVDFVPDPTATTFANEVYHDAISSLTISETDPSVFIAQCIIPSTSGGYTVRGIAIYASDGTLYATGNYANQDKPSPESGFAVSLEILAELAVSDTSDITLVVSDTAYLTEEQGDTLYLRQDKQFAEIKTLGTTAQQTARSNLALGSAATHDVTTSSSDPIAGHMLKVGDGGLLGPTLSVKDADLADKDGLVSMLFKQGNGSDSTQFGGYGCGAHLLYGDSGDGSQALGANLFIDSNGILSVEWLAIKKADGSIVTKILNKVISSAGGTIVGDASPLILKNKNQDKALYLLGKNADGENRWYIGNGADNSDCVNITNYIGGNAIILNADGSINISGKTRVTSAIEVATSSSNSFRMVYGNYGAFWRNDGSNLYLMLTDSGEQYGDYNSFRPFAVNLPTGAVTIGKLGLVDYSNFDARYYTQSASNARFVQGVHFGASTSHPVSNNNSFSTAGYSLTGYVCDGNNDDLDTLYAKVIQQNINGTFVTIPG